jgi:hypothetical protein
LGSTTKNVSNAFVTSILSYWSNITKLPRSV